MTQHALTNAPARPTAGALRIEWARAFTELFDEHFASLFRVLDRLSGDPELASEAAQDAFMQLYRRGDAPHDAGAWLFTVGMNRLRNERSQRGRRRRLLTAFRSERVHSDPAPAPDEVAEGAEVRDHVRRALMGVGERDRRLLVLHIEGYSHREIARALSLHEPSVGTLLRRAKKAFRRRFEERHHVP